jgi:hypothetical protein
MESYLLTFSPMKKKGIPFIWPQKLSHIALLWLNLCWDYLLIFLSYFFLKVFYLWTGRVAQVVKCLPSKSSKCEPLNSSPSTTRKKKIKETCNTFLSDSGFCKILVGTLYFTFC